METRICSFFLGVILISTGNFAYAQADDRAAVQNVIEPDLKRRDINESNIDTEDFEIGLFAGVISIEDFSSSSLVGARLTYHINEDFFVEASYGQATAGETSFELLSGGAPFLTEDEREYSYYDLSLGYNLNGEVFLSRDWVFNSATYFTLGAGSTEFGGDNRFTVSVGAGYRLLLTDYFAVHVGLKDHIFNSEIIGEEKTTHNIEYGLGATFFF
ncbi:MULTISPECIES: outer membrane beta-barrel domain-containing protein [Alteromonadaceae]|uniref:outer membrane beta-barrel domain-containing protein n=1 Tax=Alteromonadaceae TaxID=72275 RepID=UPI001C0A172B|nr:MULTISPECIES: outer membrane beta-barrel domain-containing protein [unclassified Aliiglaciecola]MBU2877247.1 outer membrane beta-barrel domain-containing protein [Aliiglaciecola lipolytica]MDO6712052.1 outer membrane beta-barrel domain-containing protein [Aliiglaciecola sp. 2_MG-2023]MDO6754381.1 outer membrane beta-barrel domain-containing protein [Aliiglaciecola sp. 1_MG-2023]